MQQSFKLGGTNNHFKWVKVPGTLIERPATAVILRKCNQ